ncbi:unnamed protein product [Protopolystoma xenopodis]|uniref:Uncharacterized protein n=1 Tax=Protopolystoma xenopodis TaxID=117903 RepID=A0A448WRP8_9PLAT|nr:unnamed protein product [Protopolystoma xenopodis]
MPWPESDLNRDNGCTVICFHSSRTTGPVGGHPTRPTWLRLAGFGADCFLAPFRTGCLDSLVPPRAVSLRPVGHFRQSS